MTTLTVRCHNQMVIDYFGRHYRSVNRGACRAVELFGIARAKTLDEIRGKFKGDELKVLIDVFNVPVDYTNADQDTIWKAVENACIFQGLEIDRDIMHRKIESLSISQVIFLLDWIKCYHETNKKKNLEIDEYINQLI